MGFFKKLFKATAETLVNNVGTGVEAIDIAMVACGPKDKDFKIIKNVLKNLDGRTTKDKIKYLDAFNKDARVFGDYNIKIVNGKVKLKNNKLKKELTYNPQNGDLDIR